MARTEQSLDTVQDLEVIADADCHVQETVDEFLPYMKEGPSKDLVEASPLPLTEIYSVVTTTPTFVYDDLGDQASGNILADTQPLDELLGLKEELGIGPLAVNPTLNLLIATINNDRIAVDIADAYNDWILDEVDGHDRVKANILVPPQKPDKAAEQIDKRADDKNVSGVQLVTMGLFPPPGHEWYDPIYETAQAHGFPIAMHSATGVHSFPRQFYWNETFAEDHLIEHPFQHMWDLTTMLFRGVPERFPDLNFILQEAGLGYIPYLRHRLDDHYLEFGYELPDLDKLPSKYLDDQFYFTTQPLGNTRGNPKHLAYTVEMVGPDNVMFSADMPHADFDNPGELFDRIKSHFDDDTLRNIMGGTAIDLYGL